MFSFESSRFIYHGSPLLCTIPRTSPTLRSRNSSESGLGQNPTFMPPNRRLQFLKGSVTMATVSNREYALAILHDKRSELAAGFDILDERSNFSIPIF